MENSIQNCYLSVIFSNDSSQKTSGNTFEKYFAEIFLAQIFPKNSALFFFKSSYFLANKLRENSLIARRGKKFVQSLLHNYSKYDILTDEQTRDDNIGSTQVVLR